MKVVGRHFPADRQQSEPSTRGHAFLAATTLTSSSEFSTPAAENRYCPILLAPFPGLLLYIKHFLARPCPMGKTIPDRLALTGRWYPPCMNNDSAEAAPFPGPQTARSLSPATGKKKPVAARSRPGYAKPSSWPIGEHLHRADPPGLSVSRKGARARTLFAPFHHRHFATAVACCMRFSTNSPFLTRTAANIFCDAPDAYSVLKKRQ